MDTASEATQATDRTFSSQATSGNTELWAGRARAFFDELGLTPLSVEDYLALVPADRPELDMHDGNFLNPESVRVPSLVEIRRFCNSMVTYEEPLCRLISGIETQVIAHLANFIEQHDVQRVVDAGCGTGITLIFLARSFPQVKFVGYDISRRATIHAQNRRKKFGCKNVRIITAPHTIAPRRFDGYNADLVFTKGSLGAGSFDVPQYSLAANVAIMRQTLLDEDPMVQQWKSALQSIHNLLRPEGWYMNIAPFFPTVLDLFLAAAMQVGFEYAAIHEVKTPQHVAMENAGERDRFIAAPLLKATPR